ncbi:hypothetical protein BW723_16835 [Polaribacter reichenbachii]|uniref:Lipoprotein n=1 Tax=Polaribacter reichenbachii TaxID=996801 RepID=A0A1B8U5Q7_9FLAO|nr:hypothetical protein [Polaribacter reichenbachii]APZ47856.1 hypothetical protein BW723_16835 [Polaribacter reichenbachii]AUC18490.1 hypothetical protein BTO17_07230 [Polaribacter reichenbachii]OBY67196.1 hypothetical protein LPB301_03420 [Polaribacter reichenbachii]
MKKVKFLLLAFLTLVTVSFSSCEELFGLEDEDDNVVETVACGDYNGPSNIDNQYDYQCQAAYAYKCNGETEALASQCAYYKQLQQQLNLPDCDYCD